MLDVACGRGAVLLPSALAVGAGRVLGVDLSPEMVRLAGERLVAAGLHAETTVMDAEQLDLPDASFDAVLCAFGIFFLPDPDTAIAEFRRVLTPRREGRAVDLGCRGSTMGVGGRPPRRHHGQAARGPTALDDAAHLEALLTDAGFGAVHVNPSHLDVALADADEWWAWKWSYSFRGILEQLPAARIERLRAEARPHIDRLDEGHGLPLRLEALFALATKSESADQQRHRRVGVFPQ